MAINLLRNTRLFVSTISSGTLTNFNTWEIPVQGDFSFSQSNESQDITVSEAGTAPVRGAAVFNTALNPVDWSFTTYMRPYLTYTLQAGNELRSCIERIMWHGLVSPNAPDFTNGVNNECEGTTTAFNVNFTKSNVHSFAKLYFYIKTDNQWYKISNTQVNQAEIDFNLDVLGSITWSGFGTTLERLAVDPTFSTQGNATLTGVTVNTGSAGVAGTGGVLTFTSTGSNIIQVGQTITIVGTMGSGTINGSATQSTTYYVVATNGTTSATLGLTVGSAAVVASAAGSLTGCTVTLSGKRVREYSSPTIGGGTVSSTMKLADYIVQKYSILTITSNEAVPVVYTVPITGGSLTINNNITYLTPEVIGVVNKPIGSFTGSRSISGNLTCYLRSGGTNPSSDLMNALLTNSSSTTNSYTLSFQAGGSTNPKVTFTIPNAQLQIPTIDVQDVISLNLDFRALPHNGLAGASRATDIAATNDMSIAYTAATATTDTIDLGF